MKAVFPVSRTRERLMDGKVYGELMKQIQFPIVFSDFQKFCVEKLSLDGDYPSIVLQLLYSQIFAEYISQISTLSPDLSPEEYKQKRGEIYADAMRNVENLCLDLIRQWTLFHNSDINWRQDETGFFHIPSQTSHRIDLRKCLPYYLGTSVLIEEDPSEPSKGKKKKGKPAPEGNPRGEPVHVFMNSQSGEVFTVPISE